ncbi:hypothetical protein LB557_24695 [Mesorhizobium sp. BR115XR7A]|uniref:hypothetical protein n=1 Tax=Mesorhizobium sp. BR115XR7A TaxID=2876645 RepID=UPI001CCD27D0|nr:hypothetical protein [Mesorhizobium sp. BR115XR7A]MBZ9909213.1 hypothetical protein [Mesorhizobium sp. BR115XR7A]MBZ9933455.1 hypothetical protein [Mesorhizobium sp. BR1-1-5]
METSFDDLTHAVKAPQKSPRLGIALAAVAFLATCAGVGFAIKTMDHKEAQLPAIDIGQILHPGVV